MKYSRFKAIQPKLLNNDSISSWFTLRNQAYTLSDNQIISGLNLGFNTGEAEAVINKNRELLLDDFQIDSKMIAFGNQVHKTEVREVTTGGIYDNTDAFVTNSPEMALAIQVADCAAILLGDEKNAVIGAAHAGWRGAVAEIIPKTIHKMKKLGAETKSIKVFVSPCISQANFEVGDEVAEQFPADFVDYSSFRKPHVDLKGFLRNQLLGEGIADNNIEINEGCTFSEERFYSYRRQKEKSGRMMGIIKLNG